MAFDRKYKTPIGFVCQGCYYTAPWDHGKEELLPECITCTMPSADLDWNGQCPICLATHVAFTMKCTKCKEDFMTRDASIEECFNCTPKTTTCQRCMCAIKEEDGSYCQVCVPQCAVCQKNDAEELHNYFYCDGCYERVRRGECYDCKELFLELGMYGRCETCSGNDKPYEPEPQPTCLTCGMPAIEDGYCGDCLDRKYGYSY